MTTSLRLRLPRPLPGLLVPSLVLLLLGCVACSSPAQVPTNVKAAPPPKDDGKPSEGGEGGLEHSAALEQLRVAPLGPRDDKQGSVRMPLPDPASWTRVKFWGVKSLVGFRYGKGHHGIAGAFVTHVVDNKAEHACNKSFEDWAKPMIQLFEVEMKYEPPTAFSWHDKQQPKETAPYIIPIDSLTAKTATLAVRDEYVAAYAVYPVWNNACLVVGVGIPSRDDLPRAKAARDRFAKDVFPAIEILSKEEPPERY